MGTTYRRGDSPFIWIAFKDAAGRRQCRSSGEADEEKAKEVLRTVERGIAAKKALGVTEGPLTVKAYFEKWIERRRRRGVGSTDDDETRVRLHALPVHMPDGRLFGSLMLADTRKRHLLHVVEANEAKKMPSRTLLNVYGVLRVMFGQAETDELIDVNPCTLKASRGELPRKRDKDPSWRPTAVFDREEVEMLISSPKIPLRRRVIYALEFLTGSRANEITPRRWSHYDTVVRPLGKLTIATSYNLKKKFEKRTKTDVTRLVPVHPTLAAVLAQWKLRGWEAQYGRAPTPADLIVPSAEREDRFMSSTSNLKRLHEDMTMLGLRKRRQHDSRRTFISLGIADGGRKDILKWITHPPRGVMDDYTTLPWATLCAEVSLLNIQLREGKLLSLASSDCYAVATENGTNEND